MLEKTIREIDRNLELFITHVRNKYQMGLVDPILYAGIKEFVLRKGKRIRPMLLIFSYKGYSRKKKPPSPSIYYVSTCIELLHNFMLIHDDIIDRSALRRGKPTLHRLLAKTAKVKEPDKLGCDLGIVAGDIIYALAIEAFLSANEPAARKEAALHYFIQTAVWTAMGEFIDTLHGVKPLQQVKEKDVLLNYSLKTARYTFVCPLMIGAILAGAPRKDLDLLPKLGLSMGQAFQIQDDIIGIFDTQKNIGKSILSDLAENKKTLLVCHAAENLPKGQYREFLALFNKPRKTYADLVTARKIFVKAGSLRYGLHEIEKRLVTARDILERLSIKPRYRNLIGESVFRFFKHSQDIAQKNRIDFRF